MNTQTTFAKDTSGRTPGQWAVALITLLIGLIIAHLGVTMFLVSELGTDTFTVFIQGLSLLTGLSIGTVHVITLCLIMLLLLIFTRGYIKPGSVICAFFGGPIIDFFLWLSDGRISAASPLYMRICVMILGLVILALGMSVVIQSEAGTGPNDLIAIVLTDKLKHFQFRWMRVGCDVFFVIFGYLLGGVVGVGTVAAVILTGPVVQFWLPRSQKLVKKIYGKFGMD